MIHISIKKEVQKCHFYRNDNYMKIKIKTNSTKNEDNLLPLVNIIFLLLIFFMLAGVIAKQKEMYDVELASAIIEDYIELYRTIKTYKDLRATSKTYQNLIGLYRFM